MKKREIEIGERNFKTKKSAIEFYKTILNKYDANMSLDDSDYSAVLDLFNYNPSENNQIEEIESLPEEQSDVLYIDDIIVDLHPVYKKTKCFYIISDEEKWLFSYLLAINGNLSDEKKFTIACRNAIKNTLHKFKEQLFENKPVKCAITKKTVGWENSHIDHKAPMTFSVIVKTFINSNAINIANIELEYEDSLWSFSDKDFERKFIDYHNKVALLRIISSEENLKISSNARLKPTKNDHVICDKTLLINIKKNIDSGNPEQSSKQMSLFVD